MIAIEGRTQSKISKPDLIPVIIVIFNDALIKAKATNFCVCISVFLT